MIARLARRAFAGGMIWLVLHDNRGGVALQRLDFAIQP
jgi:hypothetical protein